MASIDGIDEVVLNLLRNKCCRLVDILNEELDVVLDGLKLILDGNALLLNHLLQWLNLCLWQCQNNFCLERNGIAHVAAVPADKTCTEVGNSLADEADHLFVGIGTTLIDFQS